MSQISFKYLKFFSLNLTILFVILISFSISIISCAPTVRIPHKKTEQQYAPAEIRIFIQELSDPDILEFGNDVYLDEEKTSSKIPAHSKITIREIEGEIRLRYSRYENSSQSFTFIPVNSSIIYNNKEFRGRLKLTYHNSKIFLTNYLDIEEYLKGVLIGEMGLAANENDYEALKAFAVCARNFAYKKVDERKPDFDVYGDTRDQVYIPGNNVNPYIVKAVQETRGMILYNGNDPANTFYYSCCGGYTENYENVFRGEGFSYLKTVQDGAEPYCRVNPSFSWTERYTQNQFINLLRTAGLIENENYSIKDIDVKSRFSSGRINELEIILSGGGADKSIILKGNNIRYVIRSSNKGILKSTLCEFFREGPQIIIKGNGNGHGVGLCQWGAIGQSRQGKSFGEILYFYFPGTRIEHLSGVKGLSRIEND